MNPLFKNKFFNSLVILLMIANIITIGLFWWNNYNHQPPHRIGMERNIGPADFIPSELKMTEMQTQQWTHLKEEHRASVPLLRKNIEQAKDAFFKLVKTETPADSAINSAWEIVNIAEKAIHINTLQHFNAIRKICTPEQKKRFDEIIEQAIKNMGREGRPGDPRRFPPSLPSNE
jgi:Spy/CpxP family protein refolding chaperone